jgi:capsular exopolysaccharide synthesis family protein
VQLKIGAARRNGLAEADLVTVRNPRSAAAEAYRALRTNLQFSALDRDLRTVLATGAGPGVGTTTVLANLGVSLAEAGERVLLLDCDLRRPSQHLLFGLALGPGLSNALAAHIAEPVISATVVPGLSLLAAGDPPPNPAEFVASGRLTELLDRLRTRFDRILIDTPPAGILTDAAVLAPRVDGVMLVVSAGQTRRDLARRAHQQLETVGAHLLGAVINRAKLGRNVGDYYAATRG